MKKIRNLVLILMLFMSLNRCEKNPAEENLMQHNNQFTVEQAQAWFGAEWTGTISLKSGSVDNPKIGIKPDWCDAFTSQNDQVEVVEVNLMIQGRFDMADEASYKEWEKTKNEKMITSLTRMVYLKYKKDGRIDQFLMTVSGDKDYHENMIGHLSDNSYLSREKHYSGRIYYHDLNGNFVNGWVYEKGRLVGKATQNSGDGLPTQLKMATTCITTITHTTYVQCTDWYSDAAHTQYTNTTCGDPYVITSSFTECPVYFTSNNSFGINYTTSGGISGGYNPPPVDPNKPCLGDPIKNPAIASSGASGQHGGLYRCVRQGEVNCDEGIYTKKHGGIDIYAPENSDCYSISSGKVSAVGVSGDLGNYIQVTSNDGLTSILYAHLNSAILAVGNDVNVGDKLGLTGKTGNAASSSVIPHGHIQVKVNGIATDPQPFLSTTFNSNGTISTPCN